MARHYVIIRSDIVRWHVAVTDRRVALLGHGLEDAGNGVNVPTPIARC